MIAVSEAFVLAEKLGLDAQKLFDISSKSSGQCWSMTSYCPVPGPVPTSPANRDYQAGFTAAMMLKDLKLAQDAAKAAGATTPLGADAAQIYQRLRRQRGGGTDFSGIIDWCEARLEQIRADFIAVAAGVNFFADRSVVSAEIHGVIIEKAIVAEATVAAVHHRTQGACEKCPLRGKEVLRDFTAKELAFVASSSPASSTSRPAPDSAVRAPTARISYTVLSGWAFRYKTLPDGRRQILNYALPGDLLGLQGSVSDEMQHSVEALTDMMLCVFPREKLWELYSDYPALAFDVTWLAAREEQISTRT